MSDIIDSSNPCDIDTERALLGTLLSDREAIIEVTGKIDRNDFYIEEHKLIFEAIMQLFNESSNIDIRIVNNRVKKNGYEGTIIDLSYLGDLTASSTLANYMKDYAKIIKDKSLMRELIKSNKNILTMCYEGKNTVDEVIELAQKNVLDMQNNKDTNDYAEIKDVIITTFENIEEVCRNKKEGIIPGIPTDFYDLDQKTGGLQPKDMILIAARPSMGKTAFAINIVENVAIRHNIPTAVFSLEMSKEQIVNRILSGYAMIDAHRMRMGELTEEDFSKMVDAMDPISNAPIYIDDTPAISIAEFRSKCMRLKLEKGIKLVVIDYLQLMVGSGGKNESRQQEISEISRNIKSIAKDIDAPIIALSQLSRACESRDNKRPMLSDLRESGAIEQDADLAMFLYRDEYYNPDSEKKGQGEIIIAKNRNGSTGTVDVGWLGNYTKYVNLDKVRGN